MRDFISGADFKKMILNAATRIEEFRQDINELNVFPVPDGDTGTNMSLTINAAVAELKKTEPDSVGQAAEITASALLRGARGNSGVILSLLFRGLARHLKGKIDANAADFALAMSEGVTAAYKAVMKPTEGTILTVSRLCAAEACDSAGTQNDIEAVFEKVIDAGYKALDETVNQNPVLKKANVIDAGAKGYMLILDAMLDALRGKIYDIPVIGAADSASRSKAVFAEFETGDITFGYCTEFIVERENSKDPRLLWDFLGSMGDSAVVVDDDEIIKVHVHTDRPGDVLTEALTYGSLLTVKVENMREQHTEAIELERMSESSGSAAAADAEEVTAPAEKELGVVAVCAGEGIAAIFMDLGVDRVVSGGQTMNPSTEDILREINRTPANVVFVLPNNGNIKMAAEQCSHLTEKKVVVLPTTSLPQGISAMLSFEPEGGTDENIENMNAAISNVKTLSVTYAARNSVFDEVLINEGDYLILLENKLVCNLPDENAVRERVIEILSGIAPEFVTFFYGRDVDETAANAFSEAICAALPDTEITSVSGGQPVYHYIISAE